MGGIGLCHNEQTAGVLVYAVDYSRADNSVYGRKPVAAVIHECIYQRSRIISCSGVDYHALGLVYHQQIIVLIDYFKGDILRLDLQHLRLWDNSRYLVPLSDDAAFVNRLAVDSDLSLFDKLHRHAAADVIAAQGDELVYPHTVLTFVSGNEKNVTAHCSSPLQIASYIFLR